MGNRLTLSEVNQHNAKVFNARMKNETNHKQVFTSLTGSATVPDMHGNCKDKQAIKCPICEKYFEVLPCHAKVRKFCSLECAYKSEGRTAHIKKKERGSRICEFCQKEFFLTTKTPDAKFCSRACALRNIVKTGKRRTPSPKRKFISKECPVCKNTFDSWESNHRVYCSSACSREPTSIKAAQTNHARGNYMAQKQYTRGIKGWVEIGGKKFFARSSWEANYGRYLQFQKKNGIISDWEHEPETFWFKGIKRGVCSYLPDFKVTTKDGCSVFHEVKGWMDKRSKTKIKRMAKYHPNVNLIIIDAKRYAGIKKSASHLVAGWTNHK